MKNLRINTNELLLNSIIKPDGKSIFGIDKGDYSSGWTYDANGNRTSDPTRGITSITYNYYNQPVKFTFSDGSTLTNYYRSDGTYYGRMEREAVISTVNSGSTKASSFKGSMYINKGDFVFLNTVPNRLYIEVGYVDIDFEHSKGTSIVSELQSSDNVFTIKSGQTNEFKPNNSLKAGANLTEVQAATGNIVGSTGSSGIISWNPSSTKGGFDLSGGTNRPAYISLGHEMAHGSDANQGLLHFSSDYTNSVSGVQYQSSFQGLLKSEWRAVYRENLILGQARVPLRTNYGIDISTGTAFPVQPRLLDATNQPLNYP